MHGSRRVVGVGNIKFPRFLLDKRWHRFTEALFAYQYVREPVKWTEAWSTHLFLLVLGVTDLAVKLFVMTQRRAILERKEAISPELMRQEFNRSFSPVFRSLKAIADNLRSDRPDPMSEPDELTFRGAMSSIQPGSVPAPAPATSGGGQKTPKRMPTAEGDRDTNKEMEEVRRALDEMDKTTIASVVAAGAEDGKSARQALVEAGMAS